MGGILAVREEIQSTALIENYEKSLRVFLTAFIRNY